jgi:hypothetical protein
MWPHSELPGRDGFVTGADEDFPDLFRGALGEIARIIQGRMSRWESESAIVHKPNIDSPRDCRIPGGKEKHGGDDDEP